MQQQKSSKDPMSQQQPDDAAARSAFKKVLLRDSLILVSISVLIATAMNYISDATKTQSDADQNIFLQNRSSVQQKAEDEKASSTLADKSQTLDKLFNEKITQFLHAGGKKLKLSDAGAVRKRFINGKDDNGRTPLMMSCYDNYIKKAAHTLEPKQLQQVDTRHQYMQAFAKYLLDQGADLHVRDKQGWTALDWACWSGLEGCVQELLARGAEVNSVDKFGQTPLMRAAVSGNMKIVELLLDKGADAKSVCRLNGWRASHYATKTAPQLLGGDFEAINRQIADLLRSKES